MRKEAGFEVTDRIALSMKGSQKVAQVAKANEDKLRDGVLAISVCYDDVKGYEKAWKINGEDVVLGVEKQSAQ